MGKKEDIFSIIDLLKIPLCFEFVFTDTGEIGNSYAIVLIWYELV